MFFVGLWLLGLYTDVTINKKNIGDDHFYHDVTFFGSVNERISLNKP